jgi:hypothetical protein
MQYWNTTSKIILFHLLGLHFFYTAHAQENSPYTRYALGNIKLSENAANRGMAGVSLADYNTLITNPNNPASYAGLKMTSFQVGVEGISNNIKNASVSNRTGAIGLSYVNIGLPIAKNLGVSFGLIPQTQAKYSMQQEDSIPGVSKVLYNYYGGGATQKIYVGGAYALNDFSFGLNTGYTFGNVINTSDAQFVDSLKILSTSVNSRTVVGGFFLQGGVMMQKKLKKDYSLTLGATYTLQQQLKGKKDTYWKSFRGDVSDPDYLYNVDSVIERKGTISLPSKLGLGVMFSNGDIWKVGLDINSSNWKNYTAYNQPDSTGSSWNVRIGGAITPDPNSLTQFWKHLTYRVGLYTGKDILSFKDQSLGLQGFTVGIGYPIRRTNMSIGQINAALDVGKRGTTDNGLIAEQFTRFTIGLTFNDKWFIKRRYD